MSVEVLYRNEQTVSVKLKVKEKMKREDKDLDVLEQSAELNGTNSFQTRSQTLGVGHLKKLEAAKASAVFQGEAGAFVNASGTGSFHSALQIARARPSPYPPFSS